MLEADLPRGAPEIGIPILVIEILSPSTGRRDREVKRRIYLAAGVREVWIVDPARRSIELYTADGRRLAERDEALTSLAVPGLTFRPNEVFAD